MALLGNPQDILSTAYPYSGQFSPEAAIEEQALNRRRLIANMLLQQGQNAPQGQMVGRFYVPASPIQHGASLLSTLVGALGTRAIDDQQMDVAKKDRQRVTDALTAYKTAISPKTTTKEIPIEATRSEMPDTFDINELTGGVMVGSVQPKREGDTRAHYLPPSIPVRERNGSLPTTQTMPVTETTPAAEGDKRQALIDLLTNTHPQVRGMGQVLMQQAQHEQDKAADKEFKAGEAKLQREFLAGEHALNRTSQETLVGQKLDQALMMGLISKEQRDQMMAMQAKQNELSAGLKKAEIGSREAIAKQHDETLKAIAAMKQDGKGQLPAPALKMQQEELDAIGLASGIKADVSAIRGQLESGKLNLGPMKNAMGTLKNATGFSDENSRNLASFHTTLERIRNDSLKLNKGVMTEGDAQRAWNEAVPNLNDPNVVKQLLMKLEEVNARGVELRKMNIGTIRQNFGADPLDTSKFESVAPAIGSSGSSGPKVGTVEDGYRFKGGNPADPKAWEKVQ